MYDGDVYLQRIGPPPRSGARMAEHDLLYADGQATRLERPSHSTVKHHTLISVLYLILRHESVKPGNLLVANRRVASSPNQIPWVVITHKHAEGLARKFHLHHVEVHTPITLYEPHDALFSGLCKADVGLPGCTAFPLTAVPVKALVIVSAKHSGILRLNMSD